MARMTDALENELSPGWAARRLSECLTLISSFDDESSVTARIVERAAEVLEADAAALVGRSTIIAKAGPRARVAGRSPAPRGRVG